MPQPWLIQMLWSWFLQAYKAQNLRI